MRGVTIVDHPLVQHKLTLLRDKNRSTKAFRELFAEIGELLCYEVTRDLPLEMIEIETPFAKMQSPILTGKKLVLAPIVRAGMGFLEGMLELLPAARVARMTAVMYWITGAATVSVRTAARVPNRTLCSGQIRVLRLQTPNLDT